MALVPCSECKAQISTAAKKCPQCGAPQAKKHSRAQWITIGVETVIMVSCISKSQTATEERTAAAGKIEAQKTPEQRETEAKAKARDDKNLNGAVAAAKTIKASSKDPSSFKLESLVIYESGATCMEFRAKNSFGAIVPAKAFFDGTKRILSSERDGNVFVKAWNDTCTKTGGVERAGAVNTLGLI